MEPFLGWPRKTSREIAYELISKYFPLLILFFIFLSYRNSFFGPFIYDDLRTIVANPHIRHVWPLSEAMSHPFWFQSTEVPIMARRPIVSLSFALNYKLGLLHPLGYHLLNVLIHLGSTLALYGLIRRTLLLPVFRNKFNLSSSLLGLLAALLWGVHPMQTESVTYIVQRCESLMGLFYFLTLYSFVRAQSSSGHTHFWKWCAVSFCYLGMGTKESMITAPIAVFIFDRIFVSLSFRQMYQKRKWFYMALFASWLVLAMLLLQKITPFTEFNYAVNSTKKISILAYGLTQTNVILHYIRQALWPNQLILDYYWPIANSVADVWPSLVGLIFLLTITAYLLLKKPKVGFLAFWFFLTLAPTSSFYPISNAAFEHRMYLPLASVVLFAVLGLYHLFNLIFKKGKPTSLTVSLAVALSLAPLTFVLSYATFQRNEDYRSELAIWYDTLQKRPRNPRALYNFGFYLYERMGSIEEAVKYIEDAVQSEPNYAIAHNFLGFAYATLGEKEKSVEHSKSAIRTNPKNTSFINNLGDTYKKFGDIQDAIIQYQKSLEIAPNNPVTHMKLGSVYASQRNYTEAFKHFQTAYNLVPDSEEVLTNMAVYYRQTGDLKAAEEMLLKALDINPASISARYEYGLVLSGMGKMTEAQAQFDKVLKMNPFFRKIREQTSEIDPSPIKD